METIDLIAFSDYLCPWCYNASVRLRALEAEFAGRVRVGFRAYLLRPEPRARDLERFRLYTKSWERPAAEPEAGEFQLWQGDAGPPSHSVPPHLAAKAAASLGEAAFRRFHERLLHAYFAESRDVTDDATLRALWQEAELDPEAFERREDPALAAEVMSEHAEARELGVSGVPAVMTARDRIPITGALPLESYRRWMHRLLGD